jgi:hypothetical protein
MISFVETAIDKNLLKEIQIVSAVLNVVIQEILIKTMLLQKETNRVDERPCYYTSQQIKP